MTEKQDKKRRELIELYISKLDKVAIAMEEVWFSKEVLLDLVEPELKEKFKKAEHKLNLSLIHI